MKQKLNIAMCAVLMAAAALTACQGEAEDVQPQQPAVTYPMSFDARLTGFDAPATRATTEWPDKAAIFLCLHNGSTYITGTANYDKTTDQWSFTPTDIDAPLKSDAEGTCEAYYFSPKRQSGSTVTVGTDVITYETLDGAFSVDDYAVEEGLPRLIVRATLSPKTGRIRFVGTASKSYTVQRLRTVSSFTVKDKAVPVFQFATDAVSVTCGSDGSTPYVYALFPESSRTLRITHTAQSYFERSFNANVLKAGSSGYLTIPTIAKPGSWTLKNNSGQTITEVKLTDGKVDSKSYRSARVSSTLDTGNGTVTESGFIYATSSIGDSEFNRSDVKKVTASGTTLTATLTPLEPTTTYYVRAYAANELGRRLGSEFTFTTEEKPEGTTFDRNEFEGEKGWD